MGNNDTIKVINPDQNFFGDKKTALMAVAAITIKEVEMRGDAITGYRINGTGIKGNLRNGFVEP